MTNPPVPVESGVMVAVWNVPGDVAASMSADNRDKLNAALESAIAEICARQYLPISQFSVTLRPASAAEEPPRA